MAKKPDEPKKKAPKKWAEVTLQLKHSINGKNYGPGLVRVPEAMAQMFRNTEEKVAEKELSLVQQRAYIIRYGKGGPIKQQVPWARFDEILGGAEININQMGGGTR